MKKLRQSFLALVLVSVMFVMLVPIAAAQGPSQGPDLTDPVQLKEYIEQTVFDAVFQAFATLFGQQQTTSATDTVQSALTVLPDVPCEGLTPLSVPTRAGDPAWGITYYGDEVAHQLIAKRCDYEASQQRYCGIGTIRGHMTETLTAKFCLNPDFASNDGYEPNEPAMFYSHDNDGGIGIPPMIYPDGRAYSVSVPPAKNYGLGKAGVDPMTVGTLPYSVTVKAVGTFTGADMHTTFKWSIGHYGDPNLYAATLAARNQAVTDGKNYVPGQILVSSPGMTVTVYVASSDFDNHNLQGGLNLTWYALDDEGANVGEIYADRPTAIWLEAGTYALGHVNNNQ